MKGKCKLPPQEDRKSLNRTQYISRLEYYSTIKNYKLPISVTKHYWVKKANHKESTLFDSRRERTKLWW